ncbi:7-cyano-7-deazaguanine synthase [Lentibacillus salinarum]|uniref:7-cyano-7-deazaguanine synthase n=1 Tax=Lentibacillus salinarum TaxID=446820 RepID=A0ABW3ZZ08_9BACI
MIHNILWTGGWDSTFRVLDVVLNKQETVQPFYVLDRRRKSTAMELKTMEQIKAMMQQSDPEAGKHIRETITIERTGIPVHDEITRQYHELASRAHLGDQHDWLARYTEFLKLDDLELSIHEDDNVMNFIKHDVVLKERDNDSYYQMTDSLSDTALKLFSRYRFPLLHMTKLDMGAAAEKSGFRHMMEQTWFCHNPTKGGRACGLCNPCQYTREEGLGRRVPVPNAADKAKFMMWQGYKRGIGKFKRLVEANR